MEKSALEEAFADHSRLFRHNKWVYPVISRRAKGLSVGVNLNPDKSCSFRCAYCQVDRTTPGKNYSLDLPELESEIITIIEAYKKNGLSDFANFNEIDTSKRIIQDICLSGDGESTLVKEFPAVCELMEKLQNVYSEFNMRLTLITNATHLQAENVIRGLKFLTKTKGEIWGKLDAGTSDWYKKINDSRVPLEVVQKNLEQTAKNFPLQIQTMLCSVKGEKPSDSEIELYVNRIQKIYDESEGNLKGVQLYGVVRHTAIPEVHPLPKAFFEQVKYAIRKKLPALPVQIY